MSPGPAPSPPGVLPLPAVPGCVYLKGSGQTRLGSPQASPHHVHEGRARKGWCWEQQHRRKVPAPGSRAAASHSPILAPCGPHLTGTPPSPGAAAPPRLCRAVCGHPGVGAVLGRSWALPLLLGRSGDTSLTALPHGQTLSPAGQPPGLRFVQQQGKQRALPCFCRGALEQGASLWGRAAGEGGSDPDLPMGFMAALPPAAARTQLGAARRFPRKNGAFMSPTRPLPRMGLGGCLRGWVSADKKGIVSLRAGFLAAPAPRRSSPQWLAFLRNCCRGANYPPPLITDAK